MSAISILRRSKESGLPFFVRVVIPTKRSQYTRTVRATISRRPQRAAALPGGEYSPVLADDINIERKVLYLRATDRLRPFVIERFSAVLSPEKIAG